jgi:hypothetical protein
MSSEVNPIALVVYGFGYAAYVASLLKDNGFYTGLIKQLEGRRQPRGACTDNYSGFFSTAILRHINTNKNRRSIFLTAAVIYKQIILFH